jgi:hypothetical protein
MLEINLHGPHALLPNSDDISYLLAEPQAWTSGIFLWTFLYNQAYRVNYIGVSNDNIAKQHNALIAEFLAGKRNVLRASPLAEGRVEPAFGPQDDRGVFVAAFPDLMEHVAALRVFFAPVDGPDSLRERIASALIARYHELGGKAAEWLDNEVCEYSADGYNESITLRFGRPAFIASLPDEMHI